MPDLRAQLIEALQAERMEQSILRPLGEGVPVERWWLSAALLCLYTNRFHLITNRAGTALYMLRCWLSVPRISLERLKEGATGGEAYESGESQLLHWIVEPDDCSALHDHPWDFQTEILEGGYGEYVNFPQHIIAREDNQTHIRKPGDYVSKAAHDLHAIGTLLQGSGSFSPSGINGGAWTCVRTSPRFRPWGFMPPGGPWINRDDYLKHKGITYMTPLSRK